MAVASAAMTTDTSVMTDSPVKKLSLASLRAIERGYDEKGPEWVFEFDTEPLGGDFAFEEGVNTNYSHCMQLSASLTLCKGGDTLAGSYMQVWIRSRILPGGREQWPGRLVRNLLYGCH